MAKEEEIRKLTEIDCSIKHMVELLENLMEHYENLDNRVDYLYRLTYMVAGGIITISGLISFYYYVIR